MTPYGLSPERYHCLLDEKPYYLVPSRPLQPDDGRPLIVKTLSWFSWLGPPLENFVPPRLADDSFLHPNRVVWVPDAATGAVWPYWVGPKYMAFLAQLAPGRSVLAGLPTHIRWVLATRMSWSPAIRPSKSGANGSTTGPSVRRIFERALSSSRSRPAVPSWRIATLLSP